MIEPEVLPPYLVADLYARRWRIEETFITRITLIGFELLVDWFCQWYSITIVGYLVILCGLNRPIR
ncbi:MAG: transposase [Moorea sp. SIO1F2]|nr:transposase [Moorena sp. SIO4A5]NEP24860.1 transposase [Moorena sp. SIO3I6]NEQ56644.1 transposase [Moorena sp. SIO4A1]NET83083.1 transposase [Moorena sp. SIO1F2]